MACCDGPGVGAYEYGGGCVARSGVSAYDGGLQGNDRVRFCVNGSSGSVLMWLRSQSAVLPGLRLDNRCQLQRCAATGSNKASTIKLNVRGWAAYRLSGGSAVSSPW